MPTPSRDGVTGWYLDLRWETGGRVLHLSRDSFIDPYWRASKWDGVVCARGVSRGLAGWLPIGEEQWDWPVCSSCVGRIRSVVFPVPKLRRVVSTYTRYVAS